LIRLRASWDCGWCGVELAPTLKSLKSEYDWRGEVRPTMTKIDPEKERERLAAAYGAMSDLELQRVGSDPGALTDWAFEALREELNRRGLDWAGKDMPIPSKMVHVEAEVELGNKPVILRRYRDMPAAFVEKSVLEDAGIECYLQDDNVVRMDWLWSNAMGGIKLIVREKDAEEAESILSHGSVSESAGGVGEE
jgi:hypothetical protein